MNKVLIAVDDTKASRAVLSTLQNSVGQPDEVVLLHVERLEGRSLMIDMLGEPEMGTLKEMIEETEHKDALDKKAEKILNYYKRQLADSGFSRVRTVVRAGHPAGEILKVANEEGVDLILLGHNGRKGLNRIISGSVSEEVGRNANMPVLVARRPVICEEPYSWSDAYAAITVTTVIVLGLFLLGIILQSKTLLH